MEAQIGNREPLSATSYAAVVFRTMKGKFSVEQGNLRCISQEIEPERDLHSGAFLIEKSMCPGPNLNRPFVQLP